MGELQLNIGGLAAFVDKVTHALLVGLGDRPPPVNAKGGSMHATHPGAVPSGMYNYSAISTATVAYGVHLCCATARLRSATAARDLHH